MNKVKVRKGTPKMRATYYSCSIQVYSALLYINVHHMVKNNKMYTTKHYKDLIKHI